MANYKNSLISVVICAFSMKRFGMTVGCIQSVLNNTYKDHEIILVIDGNGELKQKMASTFKGMNNITIVDNKKNEGPSVSRNLGVSYAKGDIIAFIDDDAVAASNWLEIIIKNFLDYPDINACGGKLVPIYEKSFDKLPEELLWIVGCTYKGYPEKKQFVRNVISANMAVKKEVFKDIQFEKMFDGENWKMEDTLLGIRLIMRNKNAILYDPSIIVYHNVPSDRTKLGYVHRRAFSEGILKADLGIIINKNFTENKIFSQEHEYLLILIKSAIKEFLNIRIRNFVLMSVTILSTSIGFIYESIIKRYVHE